MDGKAENVELNWHLSTLNLPLRRLRPHGSGPLPLHPTDTRG